jgi:hypothetical protein
MMGKQKHTEKRANAGLKIGHEEIERLERPDDAGAGRGRRLSRRRLWHRSAPSLLPEM